MSIGRVGAGPLGVLRLAAEIALVAAVLALIFAMRRTPDIAWRFGVVHRVPISQKVVALTYDDGPDPDFTPELLDVLDKYQVKATFFMIGRQMEKNPEIVRDVLARGHVVGNHTYTHPHSLRVDTRDQVISELARCEKVIEHMNGRRAQLFRPPRGLMDGMVFTVAQEAGYKVILWTVCADHLDSPTPEAMCARVVKNICPGGIILAHDGTDSSRWKDVAASPLIIEALRKQGYRFVTVPELLEISDGGRRQAAGDISPMLTPLP